MAIESLAAVTSPKVRTISTALFLRIASGLSFFHCIGHTIGGVFSVDAPPGTKEGAVVAAMKSNQFDVMAATRSYWDFFIGYGLTISVSELLLAVLFWQLADFAKSDPRRLRPIIATFLLANLAFTILAWRYFFIPPLLVDLLITIALGLAYLRAGRKETN